MASVHVTQLREWLAEAGEPDAAPNAAEGFFLEIRFDDPARRAGVVDPDFQNKSSPPTRLTAR